MNNSINNRTALIEELLTHALAPTELKIRDDSSAHQNHSGARESGGGHYKVFIISQHFANKSSVERHRLVYAALGDLVGKEIHAIQIVAKTKEEALQTPC